MKPNIVETPERAAEGRARIDWVRCNMPILRQLEEEFSREQTFSGVKALVCVHLEAKTAYLAKVLQAGGADVAVTGSNPDSTKDEVVAALAEEGMYVYARHGAKPNEMRTYMGMALDLEPNVVIDDGGDIAELLHDVRPELLKGLFGVCEETTSGVKRAIARDAAGRLEFPVMLINEARCKHLFDNVHGTGQSVWDGVIRATNLAIAGKTVVVVGYGWCGQGCALRAQGLGAQVIVCEVDPVKAADALMRGYRVMPLLEACPQADIVLTVTGVKGTLGDTHFRALKDGALIANGGHFWDEIDVETLKEKSVERKRMRDLVERFRMPNGGWIQLLGEGNIVNISCADGHPAEIMDTSFALQALCARYLVQERGTLEARTYRVPPEIDERVARMKLAAAGVTIDELSAEQERYLAGWEA